MFRSNEELRAAATTVFVAFAEKNTAAAADTPAAAHHPPADGGCVVLSRWGFHYAWMALFGVPPSPTDEVLLFGEGTVERTKMAGEGTTVGDDPDAVLHLGRFLDHVVDRSALYSFVNTHWALFDALDASRKGYIGSRDVVAAAKAVMPHVSEEVVQHSFSRLDQDHDCRLLAQDFFAVLP